MSLRDASAIVLARWQTVLACVALVVIAALAITLRMEPIYEARSRVYLFAVARNSDAQATYSITSADLEVLTELLGAPDIQNPIRSSLGLPAGFPIDVSLAPLAPMLDVTARSSDPPLAARLANTVGPILAQQGTRYLPALAQAGYDVRATTIIPAATPGCPFSPDIPRNTGIGLLAGLGLGIGLALLRAAMDTRIRSEEDLRALTACPVLGSVRRVKDEQMSSPLVATGLLDPAAEDFRRLRTNLRFADVSSGRRHCFVVSSASAGEGKTWTALNLAFAFANTGARVLLIDADLRRPSIAERLGLDGDLGLTTVLLGDAALAEVVQRWDESGPDIVTAGVLPPNPSELLDSEATDEVLEVARREYDFVLIDTPPLLALSDAILIERRVGGLLLVVAADETRKRDVTHTLRLLDTVHTSPAGIVLNKTPVPRRAEAYYYSSAAENRSSGHAETPSSDSEPSGQRR